MKTSQRMSIFVTLLATFSVQVFSPLAQVQAASTVNSLIPSIQTSSLDNTQKINTSTTWSTIDWDAPITLPKDIELYEQQVQEKINEKKYAEIKNFQPKTQKLSDKKVLNSLSIPEEVKHTIFSFTTNGTISPEAKTSLKKRLEVLDAKFSPTKISPTTTEPEIRIDKKSSFRPSRLAPVQKQKPQIQEVTKIQTRTIPQKVAPFIQTVSSTKFSTTPPSSKEKKFSLKEFFLSLVATPVHAVPVVPIIQYDPNQPHTALDEALYYISEEQNNEGSFTSSSNKLQLTYETVEMLAELSIYNNTQIDAGILYLWDTPTSTSMDQIMRSRANYALSAQNQQAWRALLQTKNTDGGFGILPGYQSDVFTTLEVVRALNALSIEYNTSNDITGPLGFLLTKIEPNGGVYLTKNANPSYYATNKMIRNLKPFENIEYQDAAGMRHTVREKIDAMIHFLASEYNTETQTFRWSSTALDMAMTAANFSFSNVYPELQISLLSALQKKQSPNGSFENSYLATVEAVRALGAPDVQVTNITASPNLRNGDPITLTITLQNKGQRVADNMDLHLFFDNLFVGSTENIQNLNQILPGETLQVNITQSDTSNLLGNVKVSTYIEVNGDNNTNNNWGELQTNFAPRANGQPSLPLYYIAQSQSGYRFAGVNVRWALKDDANRRGFLMMYRRTGTQEWNYGPLSPYMSGGFFTGVDFLEGEQYEVTIGVLGPQDVVTYFSDTTYITVTNNNNTYRGTVSGVLTQDSTPLATSTLFSYGGAPNQVTNQSGQFQFNNIPNGTGAAYLTADPKRESFVSLFFLQPDSTTQNVRVFTKIKTDTLPPVLNRVEPQVYNVPRSGRVIDFLASGTDNVAVAGAHFSVYNSATQSWEYLGMGSTLPGQNDVNFPWYIPEALSGPGFKMKAVIFDGQRNVSVERESNAFEIISGIPPQFTITSPNGNETWELGITSTVRWTTNQNNNVPTVSIDALYGEQVENIIPSAPNTGSYDWKIPGNSLYAGQNIRFRIRGQDNITQLVGEDISDAPLRVINSSTLPSIPWGEIIPLTSTTSTSPNQEISQSAATFTFDGTLHMVYRKVTDVIGTPRFITEQVLYTKKTTTSTWSEPTAIYTRQTQTDLALTGYSWIEQFTLQSLPQNKLALTFNSAYPDGCIGQNQKEIFLMTMNERGEWTAPQNVSSNQTNSQSPRISVDQNGKIHLTWIDGLTFDAACNVQGTKTLFYKTLFNGQWSPRETLNAVRAPHFVDMAVTTSGTPYIIYKDLDTGSTKYTKKQNNIWSNPVVLAQNSFEGRLAPGKGGTFHYVTKQNYQDPALNRLRPRITYFLFNSAAWQPLQEVLVTSTLTNFENPSVTADRDNRPNITSEAVDRVTNQRKIIWTVKNNNAFLPPQVIHQDKESIVPAQAALVSDGQFNLAVLYKSTYALKEHIFLSKANLLNFPPAPAPAPAPVNPPVQPSPTSTPTSTPSPASNYLTDGNMEAPTTDAWIKTNQSIVLQKTASTTHEGVKSLSIQTIRVNATGEAYQRISQLSPNQRYRLRLWFRIESGVFIPTLRIGNNVADMQPRFPFPRLLRRSNVAVQPWRLYERTFTTPANIQDLRLFLKLSGGYVYVDDITIEAL